ncbi:MAG: hypothetical protein LAP87_25975 [Acidobacteriia bacterium]|nr:hypothetical protein [Terriglobia bacterium]
MAVKSLLLALRGHLLWELGRGPEAARCFAGHWRAAAPRRSGGSWRKYCKVRGRVAGRRL